MFFTHFTSTIQDALYEKNKFLTDFTEEIKKNEKSFNGRT